MDLNGAMSGKGHVASVVTATLILYCTGMK